MPLTKKYLKSKPVCKVGFKVPKSATQNAKHIFLVGEFNKWNTKTLPMKKLKDGSFSITVDLEVGRDYQYRYLTDEGVWLNDTKADRYEYSAFAGGDNCVVTT
ncbi:MAG: isoamylase early set domain-containing protein [Desulfovibrio sp.]|jgi:1,4-alpha-glucan branching enzyme|nr:isoamylase early set domain-containing protein [Desulfovibrio sp.]